MPRSIAKFLPDPFRHFLRARQRHVRSRAYSLSVDPGQVVRRSRERTCPICQYHGRFWSFGTPPRPDAMCPGCLNLERHRLLQLYLNSEAGRALARDRVLHIAPEWFVRMTAFGRSHYVAADIVAGDVDCVLDVETLPFPDRSFDVVLANHVLEHVGDDLAAMREIRRILSDHGTAILSVPIVMGWEQTYENPQVNSLEERAEHFGQHDHLRFYGKDFPERLCEAGFTVEPFQTSAQDEIRFALKRGDLLFLAQPNRG